MEIVVPLPTENTSLSNRLLGAALLVWVLGNDITGVGVADNFVGISAGALLLAG